MTGEQIDLTRLPFYLQHEFDGAPYISAAMDFVIDPQTNKPNVGCRRLMLKSRTTLRSNLTQPSDLRRIYLGCVERKKRLPVSFVVGAHPCDFLAATSKAPIDEFELIARIRGETLPMVRGVTNNVPVPADAELVIEGYFDEAFAVPGRPLCQTRSDPCDTFGFEHAARQPDAAHLHDVPRAERDRERVLDEGDEVHRGEAVPLLDGVG